ncbi:MAG TPA: 30S ribosome-binding factor RbfA [Gemmatimonadaceae bacterium]|nr:30S ribosome-binding factor RbfA [Gemmatimonadaceae bacterium]
MASNRRPDRVAEAIRVEIATFLGEGAKDPRLVGLITVTGVDVTRDLRHAKVFVSVMGTDAERAATVDALEGMAGHLRSRLARVLSLRVAPSLSFKVDESVARAARIEELLAQVREPKPDDEGRRD